MSKKVKGLQIKMNFTKIFQCLMLCSPLILSSFAGVRGGVWRQHNDNQEDVLKISDHVPIPTETVTNHITVTETHIPKPSTIVEKQTQTKTAYVTQTDLLQPTVSTYTLNDKENVEAVPTHQILLKRLVVDVTREDVADTNETVRHTVHKNSAKTLSHNGIAVVVAALFACASY